MKALLTLLVFAANLGLAQPPTPVDRVRYVTTNPTGNCGYAYITVNRTTGVVYSCQGGVWAATIPAATKTRSLGFTFDNGATALAVGTVGYYTVPFACTIAAWNATVDAGTITVDVWKIATGTAIPTASNKICASACPAIASGTALHSTTLTGWTTAVAANDILGFYVSAAATATKASVTLECGQ